MAQKEVTLKIQADVDDSQVQDLESLLQQIVDGKITIPVETESTELAEVEARIEELEQVRADIYMGVSDEELDEVEAELSELEAKQIELNATVDSSGINETSQDLDNLEQSADNASAALEAMAMIDIAGALSQWGSQAESFAQELDNIAISTEQLAIQTGMTDAEMTGMLNNITNATFPRDEALLYVQSLDQIGVSAQNLGASATGLDKINDAFHMGAPAVNKLGQELSVLGVDMNNVSSSFNALAYANANTVGGMENFTKFLTRYDSQFHELGMTVDQAAVAIAGATHKFGGGRAALTGMSEALKNANGDLSVLEQELGLEAGALTNASQKTGQYSGQLERMAAKEGEHKTLTQQIAAALDDVAASTMGALSPFASFIGMIGNAGSFAVGINGLIQLGNTIKNIEMVQSALNRVQEADILLKARSTAATIAHTVAETARAVATKAVAVAQALLNAIMLANPILLVVAAIVALIAILWYCYNTNEEFRNSVNRLFDALTRLCNGDWTVRYNIVQGGTDTAMDMANNDASQWLSRQLMGDEAVNEAEAKMPEVKERLGSSINEMFDSIWNDGTQGFLTWLGNIAGIDIMGPLQGFYDGFMQIPQWIDVMTQVSAGLFLGWVGQVSGYFNTISSNAASFGSNFDSQISSAAYNAVSAFANGLSGLVAECWAEFNDVLNAIQDFGRQAIEAARGIGEQVKQAIWNRASPGILAKETFLEMRDSKMFLEQGLSDMVDITRKGSYNIMGSYSLNLTNPFANNVDGNTGSVVNNEFNFVINGDVDSDERMQKFADYIIDLMNFDNNTAGRTV